MNIKDKVFYKMMGDYHFWECQRYWILRKSIGYCVPIAELATYHSEKYVEYDNKFIAHYFE